VIKILYIGDVVGQPGRRALHQKLEPVVDRERIDFTIVNIENAAGGFGVTEAIMEELSELPINAYTSGNHIWNGTAPSLKATATTMNTSPRMTPRLEGECSFTAISSRFNVPVRP